MFAIAHSIYLCSLRSPRGEHLFQTNLLSFQSPPSKHLRYAVAPLRWLHCGGSIAVASSPLRRRHFLAPPARKMPSAPLRSQPSQFRHRSSAIAVPPLLRSLFQTDLLSNPLIKGVRYRSRIVFARYARFTRYLAFVCGRAGAVYICNCNFVSVLHL